MSLYERDEVAISDLLFEQQQQNQTKKQMQIQIVTTSLETKPTAKGSYQQLEVVYKNLTFQGKVESKKIMSFGAGSPSFKALSDAPAGAVYDIGVVKNAAGYNDWVSATPATADSSPTGVAAAASAGINKATTSPKSTYETPEERAQRQILIVRQSSVSSAVAALVAGAKSPPKVEDVIAYAQKLEGYVFGIKDPGPSGFGDIPDFDELGADVI